MQKRVFIIHGWDGSPENHWFPWLKKELESRGFVIQIPKMPNTEEPRINNWVPKLQEMVKNPDEQTYFIGHSMGNQAIVRYLESLPENIKIGGVVFVAGFLKKLTNLEDEKVVRDVANEWLTTPLDFNKARSHIKNSVAIFSDNDLYVPINEAEEFKSLMDSKIIIEHKKGHFNEEDGVIELPSALESLLEIVGEK
jgi:predicted alpha/beta hydrolase family esterase